jgi:hypothetical protein
MIHNKINLLFLSLLTISSRATLREEPRDLVIFRQGGTKVTSTGHAHLHFQIDLGKPIRQVSALCETLRLSDERFGEHYTSYAITEDVCRLVHAELVGYTKMGNRMPERTERQKRQLLAAVGIAGIFMGLYSSYQVGELRSSVDANGKQIDAIVAHVSHMEQELAENSGHFEHLNVLVHDQWEALQHLKAATSRQGASLSFMIIMLHHHGNIRTAVQALLNHRLSPVVSPAQSLETSLLNLTSLVEARGYRLLAQSGELISSLIIFFFFKNHLAPN